MLFLDLASFYSISLLFQASNIEKENLSLGSPLSKEVSGKKSYRQYLKLSGGRLVIATPPFVADSLTFRNLSPNVRSLLVPICPWTREQLSAVESFVKENIVIPEDVKAKAGTSPYKTLWGGDNMFITVSPWCNFFQYDSSLATYQKITGDGPFFRGSYNISVEAPYVYMGEHKDGQACSLTLRVTQVIYHPELPQVLDMEPSKINKEGVQVENSVTCKSTRKAKGCEKPFATSTPKAKRGKKGELKQEIEDGLSVF